MGSEIGNFCLLTVHRGWVGGLYRKYPKACLRYFNGPNLETVLTAGTNCFQTFYLITRIFFLTEGRKEFLKQIYKIFNFYFIHIINFMFILQLNIHQTEL